MTATLPRMTEREFMEQVTQLAEIRGWAWIHVRAGRTADSWRTPISGPLGKGWPDLVLVRGDSIYFIELKRDGVDATPEQHAVLEQLWHVGYTAIWHPADWPAIEQMLA